ncbi:flagellar export chaperone FliS [Bacillus sp. EB600]|uniref:flagellar export chaperone FliS n=1 Tax=Bacillus sp. EB600 TaxID=2806345 RepID=UPI0021088183|nr:flagellar export chaperone FliS [Bacillus sp. EB600]MCQ6278702.1 flagellar export chaperone FliS [Bacillus sp. EB600]
MELLTEEILYQKSSQELTALLYEGIMTNLEESIELINAKNFIEANKKLQKANDILERLGVGLKYEAGPIAEQFDTLYNYMASQIIEANLRKDQQLIKNVLQLIQPIAEAWNEIVRKQVHTQSGNTKKVLAYENSIMRKNY